MSKAATRQPIQVPAASMAFLKSLKRNNNRDWFNRNKAIFLSAQQRIEVFADGLLQLLNRHDMIETPSGKKSLHRIYRDTRFSNNKTPYKINWSGSFTRATLQRRGGYYFHIEPGNSFIAGGFWAPNSEDLKRIRLDIAFDAAPLRKIIGHKNFITSFGTLLGEQVKTAPRGFDPSDEAIDLLRYKQFLLIRKFSDEAVLSPSFLTEADKTYRSMRPFFNYMSAVLSTDSNGIG